MLRCKHGWEGNTLGNADIIVVGCITVVLTLHVQDTGLAHVCGRTLDLLLILNIERSCTYTLIFLKCLLNGFLQCYRQWLRRVLSICIERSSESKRDQQERNCFGVHLLEFYIFKIEIKTGKYDQ